MISITPGQSYFFRFGTVGLPEQVDEMNKWFDENCMDDKVTFTGNLVNDRTYHFVDEEDAIAFKLKFGV